MRYTKAKNFIFDNKPAVKVGSVEMYESELLQKVFEEKKPFILVRECAYFVDGKSAQKDENGRTVYYYHKIQTRGKTNTLPHRYFMFNYEEIQNYTA